MKNEKIKNFWNEHKAVICFAAGAAAVASIMIILKVKNGKQLILSPIINSMFPKEMPINEIKEAVSKIEGAEMYDALITSINGKNSLHVRNII